jgi:monoamine oxidase
MQDRFDVVVVGAGAAGIAALARLAEAPVSSVALEARPRIGGRAHTIRPRPDLPLDLGAGWLHSANRNPLAAPIERAGFRLDRTPPHWERQAGNQDFPPKDQAAFQRARAAFETRLEAAAREGVDRPAAELLEPGGRWNPLLDAISTWYNGAEYDSISVLDYAAYQDSGVNWRVADGYGAAIAHFADLSRIVTDCPVSVIHRDGPELRLETPRGVVSARAVIVTAPTPALAEGRLAFSPALPQKAAAAQGLPLGLADKAMLAIDGESDLPVDGHFFGRVDRTETGSYHLRPYGRPYIEVFLGGRLAASLEAEGPGAMAAFATEELVGLLGSSWRARLVPLAETAWKADSWSLGSYSHALPGHAADREVLARPVDGRIFFAGEATSPDYFSTVHGAWASGLRAADESLQTLVRP